MSTLAEIYQLERNIEVPIKLLIDAANTGATCYVSRSFDIDAASPTIELKVKMGANLDHRHPFDNGDQAFDWWEAVMDVTVATNRTDANAANSSLVMFGTPGADNHAVLLGKLRSMLTLRYMKHNFTSTKVEITDMRDIGTVDSFVGENNLDYTVLSYYMLINIRPEAWPEN